MTYVCQITSQPPARDVEFVSFSFPLTAGLACLPVAPGGAAHEGAVPVLMHIAPGRWFAPAASDAIRALLESLHAEGSLIDVEGKWHRFDLMGVGASGVLREAIDIDAVLSGRDCAWVQILDCPAIVTRCPGGYTVWTRSSHAPHLQAQFTRLAEG